MSEQVDGHFTFTQAVRAPFLKVMNPEPVNKKANPNGTPKYSATFMVPVNAPDLAEFKKIAAAVARAKWPGRNLGELKLPWELGDVAIKRLGEKAQKAGKQAKDNSFLAGHVLLTARSKYPPQLAVLNGRSVETYEDAKRSLAAPKFYNGTYVIARVNFTTYDGQTPAPDGINAYLDMIMHVKDGPRIGGANAADVFKQYAGTYTAEDPTEGAAADAF